MAIFSQVNLAAYPAPRGWAPARAGFTGSDPDCLSGRLLEEFKSTKNSAPFDAFYRMNAGWVRRFVARSRLSRAWRIDCEETVSDIFYDVYRYAGSFSFQGSDRFRRWLLVLSSNRIRKAARERFRTACERIDSWSDLSDRGRGDPLEKLVEEEEWERRFLAWRLLSAALVQSAARLAPEERAVLEARIEGGLGYRQIAELRGLSAAQAKAMARRARQKIARSALRFLSLRSRQAVQAGSTCSRAKGGSPKGGRPAREAARRCPPRRNRS